MWNFVHFFVAGHSCTRTSFWEGRICERIPQEFRRSLATPSEKETRNGNVLHSTGTEGSAQDHLRILTSIPSVNYFHSVINAFPYRKMTAVHTSYRIDEGLEVCPGIKRHEARRRNFGWREKGKDWKKKREEIRKNELWGAKGASMRAEGMKPT